MDIRNLSEIFLNVYLIQKIIGIWKNEIKIFLIDIK